MFAHLFSFLYCIFCLSMFCVLCALLPVSLDCPLWIAPSVFSYVYLHHLFTQFAQCTESVHQNFTTVSRMEHEMLLPSDLTPVFLEETCVVFYYVIYF